MEDCIEAALHSNTSGCRLIAAPGFLTGAGEQLHVRFGLPAQPVDATQASNLSAGVSNAKVLRGRSFSWRATLFR
jgi:hypothetical protein